MNYHASMLTKSAFFLPEPNCSQSLQTTGGGGEGWVGPQGVNSRPPMIGSNQLGISPFQYNLNTPTLQGGGNSKQNIVGASTQFTVALNHR